MKKYVLSQLREKLNTDFSRGLTERQANERLKDFGRNEIAESKKQSLFARFFKQFADLSIIVLIIASFLSFLCAFINNEGFIEPFVILAIVVLNAVLGFCQELKAEKSLQELKKLSQSQVTVFRDSKECVINSENVVVGDILVLNAGNVIPCDCCVLSASFFTVNEAPLTGEALPVEKTLGEQIYSGCYVLSGKCKAVATETGMNTQLGKIASIVDNNKEQTTPLQQKLQKLSVLLGYICIGVCVLVFLISIFDAFSRPFESATQTFLGALMSAVSLAVAVIPEGLTAVVTITLSLSVVKMAKQNVIVKKLPSVETLGSVTVICTDKTGTLTQNKMSVRAVYDGKNTRTVLDENSKRVLQTALCCCSQKTNPTEKAIIEKAKSEGVESQAEILFEIPFTSERKMMSVVAKTKQGHVLITKGAFESMAKIAKNAQDYEQEYDRLTRQGFRVIAVATKMVEQNFTKSIKLEQNVVFCGLVALFDPPKPEALESVTQCKQAGISVVMITGDSLSMATHIAKELTVLDDGDLAIDGNTLSQMSDSQLRQKIKKIKVFARTTPQDKHRIVKALQSLGEVVAMTGDGVNDAPALKQSNVACAMGSGCEVAKSVADLVIADDDFSSIVNGVSTGRGVFDNILKTVTYLLSCNLGEILVVFLCLVVFHNAPFSPLQLLWLNLVTDGLPSLALGMESCDNSVMSKKPRNPNFTFLSDGFGVKIALAGIVFAICSIGAFAIGYFTSFECGTTMAFLTLSLSELFYALQCAKDLPFSKFLPNAKTLLSVTFSLAMIVFVATIPAIANVFSLVQLTNEGFLTCIGLSLIPFVLVEIQKYSTLRKTKSWR